MRLTSLLFVLSACSGSAKPTAPPPGGGSDNGSDTTAITPGGGSSDTGNCTEPKPAPDSVCQRDCGPPVASAGDPPPPWRWVTPDEAAARGTGGCPICLPPDATIATPAGDVPLSALAAGDTVWSTDKAGRRIAVPIARVDSTTAPREHALVVIELADGRTIAASPGHPTADARTLGSLAVGHSLDGAKVIGVRYRPFGEARTFDLLPASPTRAYWANGVLVGSTLR
jgi:hypothetical protein